MSLSRRHAVGLALGFGCGTLGGYVAGLLRPPHPVPGPVPATSGPPPTTAASSEPPVDVREGGQR